MSKLSNAQPGCDGVIEYPSAVERDAALDGLVRLRPELQVLPAGDTWLAWRWPYATEHLSQDPERAARIGCRQQAKELSRKYAQQIGDAWYFKGERQVLYSGANDAARGVYFSMKERLEPHGLDVLWSEDEPGVVYVVAS